MIVQILLIAGVLFILYKLFHQQPSPIDLIPGPSPTLLFGNYYELTKLQTGEAQEKWVKQYGPVVKYYIFGKPRVLITDPATVKYVLLNSHLFDKHVIQYSVLSQLLGRGLLTEPDEDIHKNHRSIISSAFAHKHLRGLVPIFQNKASLIIEDWEKVADDGKSIEIKDDIAKATADVIGEAAFGYALNSQRNDSAASVYNIFAALVAKGFSIWELMPGIKYFLPTVIKRRTAIKVLNNQVETILQRKIKERANHPKVSNDDDEHTAKSRDLLDILLDCQNEEGDKLSKDALANHTKTFLLAGYETSSVCILWTLDILARTPIIQQKLANEIFEVIGPDRVPTAEDIDKMPYLLKVVKESLRYRPPIPVVMRRATEDVVLNGYKIPKNTQVTVHIYHQHHNGLVWENPEEFNPDRWSTEEEEQAKLFGSYIPFIVGPRNCIGSRFALLEVRVMLAMLIQKLEFIPEPGSKEPLRYNLISMVPKTPVKLIFKKRQFRK